MSISKIYQSVWEIGSLLKACTRRLTYSLIALLLILLAFKAFNDPAWIEPTLLMLIQYAQFFNSA